MIRRETFGPSAQRPKDFTRGLTRRSCNLRSGTQSAPSRALPWLSCSTLANDDPTWDAWGASMSATVSCKSARDVELAIPVHPELAAIIAASTADQLTFLTTQFGRPFTSAGLGNKFREWCDQAGLQHCSAHGLRKAAARRLAEAGCTAHEIAAITGHASLKEVARYTRGADQRRLAEAAMNKVKRRTSTG